MHSLWKHPDGVLEGGVTTSTEVSLAAVSSQANAERTTQLQHEVESLRKQAETVGDQCLCERGRGGGGALLECLHLLESGSMLNSPTAPTPQNPSLCIPCTQSTLHMHTTTQTYRHTLCTPYTPASEHCRGLTHIATHSRVLRSILFSLYLALLLLYVYCCLPVQLRRRAGLKPSETTVPGSTTPTPSHVKIVENSTIDLVPVS